MPDNLCDPANGLDGQEPGRATSLCSSIAPAHSVPLRPARYCRLPRVRTLLVALAMLILLCAMFPVLTMWQRHQFVQALQQQGWLGGGVDFHRSGPEWLRAMAGEEFMEWFDPIRSISIGRPEPMELPWRRDFFSRLEELDLDFGFSDMDVDKALARFADLPQLEILTLHTGQLTSRGLASLPSAPRLGGLTFANMNCSAEDFAAVRRVPQLKYLALSGHMTNDHLAHLEALTELEGLTIWDRAAMDSGGSLDSGVSFLRGFKKLTRLDLWFIHVSGPGIAVLNDLPSLETLILAHASLTDNDLDRLDGCPQLRRLDLYGNPISDAAITRFVKSHPRLKEVGFDGTNVTPECVQKLAREYGIVGFESISNCSL